MQLYRAANPGPSQGKTTYNGPHRPQIIHFHSRGTPSQNNSTMTMSTQQNQCTGSQTTLTQEISFGFFQEDEQARADCLYGLFSLVTPSEELAHKCVKKILSDEARTSACFTSKRTAIFYEVIAEFIEEEPQFFKQPEIQFGLPTPYAHPIIRWRSGKSKPAPQPPKEVKTEQKLIPDPRDSSWYAKYLTPKLTSFKPIHRCKVFDKKSDEHTHICPYCKHMFFCKCDHLQKLDTLCPRKSCKFYNENTEITRPINYHHHLARIIKNCKSKLIPSKVQNAIISTISSKCDCLWNQLRKDYRGNFLDTKILHYFSNNGKKALHFRKVTRPDDESLEIQRNKLLESARVQGIKNIRIIRNFAYSHASESWVRTIKEPIPTKTGIITPTYNHAIAKRILQGLAVEEVLVKRKSKKIQQKSTTQKKITLQKQLNKRNKLENFILDREIERVKQELKDLKMTREEIQEELVEEKKSKRMQIFRENLEFDVENLIEGLTNDLQTKISKTTKRLDEISNLSASHSCKRRLRSKLKKSETAISSLDKFTVEQDYLIYQGKAVCSINEPDLLKIAFEFIYNRKYTEDVYEMQAEFLEPLKALISNMVHSTVSSSKLVKATLIARLTSFILGMGSSCIALVQEIKNERNWLRISIHVLSIVSQITDMILSLYLVISYTNGKINPLVEMDANVSRSMSASIINLLVQQKLIPEANVYELLKAANIEDAVCAPDKETIDSLLKGIEPESGIFSTTLSEKLQGDYVKNFNTFLTHSSKLEEVPKTADISCGQISTYEDLHKFCIEDKKTPEERLSVLALLIQIMQHYAHRSNTYTELFSNPIVIFAYNLYKEIDEQIDESDKLYGDLYKYISTHFKLFRMFIQKSSYMVAIDSGKYETNIFDMYPDRKLPSLRTSTPGLFQLNPPYKTQSFRIDIILSFVAMLASTGISIYDWKNSSVKVPIGKAIVLGSSVNKSLIEGTKDIKNYIEDCSYELFGYVIGDRYDFKSKGKEFLHQLTYYKEAEDGLYCQNPEMVVECNKLIDTIQKYTTAINTRNKDMSTGDMEILKLINVTIAQCQTKLIQVDAVLSTLGTKPCTFFDCFWGEKGSGKTTFTSQWFCPKVCEKMQWKTGVYNIAFNNDGNAYWPEYAQQHIGRVDDFLRNGYRDRILNRAQEFFGNNLYNMEGAFKKNQKNHNIACVAMSSNHCSFTLPAGNEMGLSQEGCAAAFGRGNWYHVFNMNQWESGKLLPIKREHVVYGDDYSHLKFFEYSFPGIEIWRAHELMEASKTTFPKLDPANHCTMEFSKQGVQTFTNTPLPEYILGDWYKVVSNVTYYIREITKEQILDRTITRIKAEREKHEKFLQNLTEDFLKNLDENQLPDKDHIYQELSLKGIRREMIDKVLNDKYPTYFQMKKASTNHAIFTFTGPSGTGKSYLCEEIIAPAIQRLFPRMQHYNIKSVEDCKEITCPSIIQIDDQLLKDRGQLYMDILASVPSPSIILATENIYIKKQSIPRVVLPKSNENLIDTFWPFRILTFLINLRPVQFNTFHVKSHGLHIPLDMCEGWYRRLGVSGYNAEAESLSVSKKSLWRILSTYLFTYITFIATAYFSESTAGYVVSAFMGLLCTIIYPSLFEVTHCEVPFVSGDTSGHFVVEKYGQCRSSSGKVYLDSEVVDPIFEAYKKLTISLNDIKIVRSLERVAGIDADVYIIAPSLTKLPSYINDPTRVYKTITFGRNKGNEYEIALSSRVSHGSFSTCVADFKLQANATYEEVIAMAKRTYSVLMQANTELSVVVKTNDFEVSAQYGKINYWLQDDIVVEKWIFEDVPLTIANGTKSLLCKRYVSLELVESYEISYDSLVEIYLGNFKEHPNINIKLMRALWENRDQICRETPVTDRIAIKTASSKQTESISQQIQQVKNHYINTRSTVVGAVIIGVTGLVGLCGLGTLIYSIFASPKPVETEESRNVAKRINNISPIKFDFARGNTVSKVEATMSVENVYTVNVIINHNVSQLDSSSMSDLKVIFLNLFRARIQCTDEYFKQLNFNYVFSQREAPVVVPQAKTKDLGEKLLTLISCESPSPNDRISLRISRQYSSKPEVCTTENVILELKEIDGRYHLIEYDMNTCGWTLNNREFAVVEDLFFQSEEKEDKFKTRTRKVLRYQENTPTKKGGKNKTRKDYVIRFQQLLNDNTVTITKQQDEMVVNISPTNYSTHAVSSLTPINPRKSNIDILLSKESRNIVRVTNVDTLGRVYGMGIRDRFIITNYHAFPEIGGIQSKALVELDDPKNPNLTLEISAEVIHTDKENDVVILALDRHQGYRFKDIINLYVSEDETSHVTSGCFARAINEGYDVFYSDCNISSEKKTILVTEGNVESTRTLRLVEHRFLSMTSYTESGDCGHPYLVNVPGKAAGSSGSWYFGGMHSFGSYYKACGPLISREMLSYYMSVIINPVVYDEQVGFSDDFKELSVMKCRPFNDSHATRPSIVFTDREVVEDLSDNSHVLPQDEWPLFQKNKYGYGEVENSNLSYMGYLPDHSKSYMGTHVHRPSPWAESLEQNFNIKSPVSNTEFNPLNVKDKSKLIFSIPSPDRPAKPSIMYTQISYYNDPVNVHPEFENICQEVAMELKPLFLQWFGSKHHRILSDCEVLNGLVCRNDVFYGALDGMDLNSSPGLFCSRYLKVSKRKQLLEEDPVAMEQYKHISGGKILYRYNNSEEGQRMYRRYLRKYHLSAKGIWFAPVAKDSLKDELVKNESVAIGKTRVFVACDEADNLFARKVLGTYLAKQKLCHMSRHCSVGVDAYKEFHFIDKRLRRVSCLGESGDFKHWDKNLNKIVLYHVLECVKYAITFHMSKSDKLKYDNFFKIIYMDMTHGYSFADGIIYQRHRGMPSGHLTTAPINSDCNFFYHLVVCKILLQKHNLSIARPIDHVDTSVAHIISITDFIAYGDDKKTAIHEDYINIINFTTIQAAFLEYFGLQYTLPDKGSGTYTVKPLEELDYLSRTFNQSPTGVVFPTLKESSILGMLFWCTNTTPEVLGNTLLNCRIELTLLSKERYEYYRPIFHHVVDAYTKLTGKNNVHYLPEYNINLSNVTKQILQR